jgi:hypothetical protein
LIDFLNGWSENPIWAFLEQTRDDILNDMERQRVTIDADRLTRVSLLKRAVLKRCVYGVDLNAMAVELAKVSLWLDAFTLGAPLSFLDHHLKHGNSLIGARVAEVQKALEGELTLFSRNKFAGVMLATNLMRQVSYLSDNTIEQSRKSAQAYRDAHDHLAPYKRVLDVYTSRWFGNAPIKNRKGTTLDLTVEFLRRDDTQAWLEAPDNPKNRLPSDDYTKAGLVAKTALKAAEEKRFFHWELEFPEVFFAPSRPGGQDVQLREDGGFDAVVGNPPYGMTSHIFPNNFLSDQFVSSEGRDDNYKLFIETATMLANTNGMISYIIPNTLLTNQLDAKLRQLVISRYSIQKIITFSFDVFDDPTVHPCVVIIQKCYSLDKLMRVKSNVISPHDLESSTEFTLDTDKFLQTKYSLISIPSDVRVSVVIDKLEKRGLPLGDFMYVRQCIKTGNDDKYVKISLDILLEPYKPVLRGADIDRYETDWCNTYVEYGDWLARNWQNKSFFEQPKIMIRETGERIAASSDFNDFYLLSTLYSVYPKEHLDVHEEINFLLAVINSNVAQFYMHELVFSLTAGAFTKARGNHYERLPIPRINFTTPANERERLTQQAIGAYDIGDNPRLLQLVQADIGSHKTDVVHDLLAHLAQRMIGLNKQKQTEVKRFLKWLEELLRIQPKKDGSTGIDSLSGKTIFQGYLGDYQTGEGELPWREFYYRLYQNRNRFAVSLSDVEGEIQREYEKSLETLIPIKRNLARTDVLIDKIVYRLYGLTDEEIELIERPQYEQALADAKAQVVADDKIKDDEEKIEKIAEGILPAAKRFFERVEPKSVEEMLDSELPTWRSLPPDTPTFLLTGDYSLRTLPDHMDFSASVISYAKAVEVVLSQRIFMPFRQQYTDADCRNDFLKRFMRGEKDLTLGSFMIILSSSQETALRNFISRTIPDATNRVFGTNGLVTVLNDDAMRDIRNKAAHDEVLSRNEAQEARVWAMQILRQV